MCHAFVRSCPLGGADEHYDNLDDAWAAAEQKFTEEFGSEHHLSGDLLYKHPYNVSWRKNEWDRFRERAAEKEKADQERFKERRAEMRAARAASQRMRDNVPKRANLGDGITVQVVQPMSVAVDSSMTDNERVRADYEYNHVTPGMVRVDSPSGAHVYMVGQAYSRGHMSFHDKQGNLHVRQTFRANGGHLAFEDIQNTDGIRYHVAVFRNSRTAPNVKIVNTSPHVNAETMSRMVVDAQKQFEEMQQHYDPAVNRPFDGVTVEVVGGVRTLAHVKLNYTGPVPPKPSILHPFKRRKWNDARELEKMGYVRSGKERPRSDRSMDVADYEHVNTDADKRQWDYVSMVA